MRASCELMFKELRDTLKHDMSASHVMWRDQMLSRLGLGVGKKEYESAIGTEKSAIDAATKELEKPLRQKFEDDKKVRRAKT